MSSSVAVACQACPVLLLPQSRAPMFSLLRNSHTWAVLLPTRRVCCKCSSCAQQVQQQLMDHLNSWAPKTFEKLRDWVPDGDADLQHAWLQDYLGAVQWMREMGVPTADQYGPIMTTGTLFLSRLFSYQEKTSNSTMDSQVSATRSAYLASTNSTLSASRAAEPAPESLPTRELSRYYKNNPTYLDRASSAL